jgi:hypothetical protein
MVTLSSGLTEKPGVSRGGATTRRTINHQQTFQPLDYYDYSGFKDQKLWALVLILKNPEVILKLKPFS